MPTDRGSVAVRVVAALLAFLLSVSACSGGDDGTGDGATDRAADTDSEPGAEVTDTELAAQTYVAGYPLVVSVRTMQRLGGLVGVNRLVWQNALAGPQSRIIVAPDGPSIA